MAAPWWSAAGDRIRNQFHGFRAHFERTSSGGGGRAKMKQAPKEIVTGNFWRNPGGGGWLEISRKKGKEKGVPSLGSNQQLTTIRMSPSQKGKHCDRRDVRAKPNCIEPLSTFCLCCPQIVIRKAQCIAPKVTCSPESVANTETGGTHESLLRHLSQTMLPLAVVDVCFFAFSASSSSEGTSTSSTKTPEWEMLNCVL